ncbi:MAG: hypothetical protein KAG06_01380 [Methylococcales bacterium]|nr:hypothetical protein [Methylococcales bacterium]
MDLINRTNINTAWLWVCQQHLNAPPNADIWHLRAHYDVEVDLLHTQLANNQYQFMPMQKWSKVDGSTVVMWTARDALVTITMFVVPI